MPRYLNSDLIGISVWFTLIFVFGTVRLRVKSTAADFGREILKPHLLHQI